MGNKKLVLVFGFFICMLFAVSAYALEHNTENEDLNFLLDETNESDMWGCCSIACQLDGNDSIFAFRRDAKYDADIHIEKVNWHGKDAIKQYKTDGAYFCQVIITNDGWTIGYGGLDDGEDNEVIENITADMVLKGSIDNSTLERIQQMKEPYKRGHVLIKAPNGEYGVAMATSHFTGKLKPGDYISVPNKPEYIRSGDIKMDAPDRVKTLHKLEMSDAFGVDRRDITTFYFHHVENGTFNGNVTNITLSNDDGSVYGMPAADDKDNVYFLDSFIKKEDIPVGPNYKNLGSIEFPGPNEGFPAFMGIIVYLVLIVLFIILFVLVIRLVNKIRCARKRRKQYNRLYYDDRYRYR